MRTPTQKCVMRTALALCDCFQNELKEKDLAIRKFEQEMDSLSFRNNQLSMRVNVLQQELDDAHARSKKHKVSLRIFCFSVQLLSPSGV